MSRFNQATAKQVSKTENLAGGAAYSQTNEMELLSILLTSFGTDQYYRSGDETIERLKTLIPLVNKKFVAQAAVYARTVHGMRTITHVTAGELAKHIGGESWARGFYDKVIYRVDDMTEILGYYKATGNTKTVKGKVRVKLSNAMKAGFCAAFNRFNAYQLAKYKSGNKELKLIDVVNLVRPKGNDNNKKALEDLTKDKLVSFDTWEVDISAAGGDPVKTAAAWSRLITEKKMGYLGLLRNLRNIAEKAPTVLTEALDSLTNEDFIKKSLIFPFQYLIAYKQFSKESTKEARQITEALSKAVDISCVNVKDLNFSGNTLVAIDNSGSMASAVAKSDHIQKSELGALFGVIFAKAANGDIMEFGDMARYIPYNLSTHALDFASGFSAKNKVGHGTNFHAALQLANKKYDRILYFSDMQGWAGGYSTPLQDLVNYRNKYQADPYIYSFDLAGYGTTQFKGNKIYALAGYSDKVLNTMKYFETDKDALIKEVKAIEL